MPSIFYTAQAIKMQRNTRLLAPNNSKAPNAIPPPTTFQQPLRSLPQQTPPSLRTSHESSRFSPQTPPLTPHNFSSKLPRNPLTPLPQPSSCPLRSLTTRLPLQISSNTPHPSPRHHIRTLLLVCQVRRQAAVEFGVSAMNRGVEDILQKPDGKPWPGGFGVALEFGFEVAGVVGL